MAWFNIFGDGGIKVDMAAAPDHVELTNKHLVLGIRLDWQNAMDNPIAVKELRVSLSGQGLEGLRLYPLERFERMLGHRAIQKRPVSAFSLAPGEIHTQQMRFISQEVLDLPPGKYALDVVLTDTSDMTYTNRAAISLENSIKYRSSEEWGKRDN